MKTDIGSLYASFLPGISITLCDIVTGDTKQGYAVTAVSYITVVNLVFQVP